MFETMTPSHRPVPCLIDSRSFQHQATRHRCMEVAAQTAWGWHHVIPDTIQHKQRRGCGQIDVPSSLFWFRLLFLVFSGRVDGGRWTLYSPMGLKSNSVFGMGIMSLWFFAIMLFYGSINTGVPFSFSGFISINFSIRWWLLKSLKSMLSGSIENVM